MKLIFTAMLSYLSTSLDEIPILYLLYRDAKGNKGRRIVSLAYGMGTFCLTLLGVLIAQGRMFLPEKWMVGLLGIIPIVMGVKILLTGDDDEDNAAKAGSRFRNQGIRIFVITMILGIDDLGVYVPVFATMNYLEILVTVGVFVVCTLIICMISNRIPEITGLNRILEQWGDKIVGVVFVLVGIMVLAECFGLW